MRTVICRDCAEVITALNWSRAHLKRDEHMLEKHNMYPRRMSGRIVYRALPKRSLLALGRQRYTDISGMLAML